MDISFEIAEAKIILINKIYVKTAAHNSEIGK